MFFRRNSGRTLRRPYRDWRQTNTIIVDPAKRFVISLLFQAQQDGATELVIAPPKGDKIPIKYKLNEVWYPMSSPPARLRAALLMELQRMAELPDGQFPQEGLLNVSVAGTEATWRIQLTTAEAECVLTRLTQ